jgi:hypothetical protein
MRLGNISDSTLFLWLSITPLACFLELFYALQHSEESQFSKSDLDVVEYLS